MSTKSENKEDAEPLLRQRLKEIDEQQITTGEATIAYLLQLNLQDHSFRGRSSFRDAKRNVEKHLVPTVGAIKASRLESAQIESFVSQKLAAGYEKASINRYLSSLKRGYTLSMERYPPLVTRCPKIIKLQEDNVREGFLEHEQHLVPRDARSSEARARDRLSLRMRRGEILKLRWDQVDWDANLIRLEKRQTKKKQARNARPMVSCRPGSSMPIRRGIRPVPSS